MIGRLARAAYMLIVAGMVVAWAMAPGKGSPVAPPTNHPVVYWWC